MKNIIRDINILKSDIKEMLLAPTLFLFSSLIAVLLELLITDSTNWGFFFLMGFSPYIPIIVIMLVVYFVRLRPKIQSTFDELNRADNYEMLYDRFTKIN